ncbi:hypothetical protein LMH87_003520 [Akanthomyces muscarius]|uniref:Uncharacterized protein n=1 Tax=Akanthomyces muscarius TaxID=2231603 RepID=A0A9W8UH00_AKAMU|nr:hypothetical protein LMH87_003520 [Akanthomyces muscarius]KAJ4144645.1 hypothetical protein LMH87_003520 [Akanthomyces muscarius]
MAIAWDSIKSLLIFIGPIAIPRAISYYRSSKAASKSAGVTVRPVPRHIRHALALLAFCVATLVLKTLPPFTPENIFQRTDSRLQIPTDVLFNRVAALRGGPGGEGTLTAADTTLRGKFVNLESRLLYLQFGPAVLADCLFCNAEEPKSYLYYAIPALLWAHLANFLAAAVVTSPSWTGRYGRQWRSWATVAAGAMAATDVWLTSNYNYQANARALRLADLDAFYWSARATRLWALAAFDAVLGYLIYLSATNRAFIQLPTPAERVENVNRALHVAKSKLSALGILKNTAQRDTELRERSDAYWTHEGHLMSEAMEEREVIEGVADALENRLNIQNITRDADTYTTMVLQELNQE